GKDIENPNIFIKFFQKAFGRTFGKQKIERVHFSDEIEKVIKKYDDKLKIYYAGIPVYEAKTKLYMQRDLAVLLFPAILLMILSLFLSFRTARGTILPMLAMVLSLIWTMGLLGWLRVKLNIVSILMPPIILTIGSSYTLHYLNSYYHHSNRFSDNRELVLASTKDIFPTIFMASLTTIVGFISFLTASIGVIREFGFVIMVSICFTLFFTFLLLSKILVRFNIPHNVRVEEVKNDIFAKILKGINSVVYPLRFLWVIIFFLGVLLFALVIPKLKVETNAANFFKGNDLVKQSLIFIQENFGGSVSYNITLRSVDNKRNFFKTKEGMLSAQKIQDYLDKDVIIDGYTMIGWNISPVTLLQDLNKVMTGNKGIPDDETEIKRFFSFLKASGDDNIKSLINSDFSAITFQVRCLTNNKSEFGLMSEQELLKLSEKLKVDLANIAKEDGKFKIELWGESLLLARISKYLIKDQVTNLVSTLIFVLVIVLILFRSIYYSIISVIPLTFGVLMNFAIMSIFKIPLDAGTVMIGAIAVGVGIDNSIHFILNYKKALKEKLPTKDAVLKTLLYTSRPMAFASLALIMGFLVFLLSSFKPVYYFGILIAISMFNCIFATLFILPSFLLITEKIRLFFHKDKEKIKK
ncbi:MAG TPA: MMPL family transporter, partial [Spirochaetota bacterium]|nr:MMPL family transporter [Spirochaetota bacterium]